MFDHYLLTRFNLRARYWDLTKNNEQLLTDHWMDRRMWLFENFCFPSVIGQTDRNFTWLLYFDTQTKEVYKNRILELVRGIDHVKVFFVDGMDAFLPAMLRYIETHSAEKPYVITSRLDNDDALHQDFVGEVQKQFRHQDYGAIDFIKGYSLQIEPFYLLGKKEQLFNPFISLIEKNKNPKTAFHQDHRHWKRDKMVTHMDEKRLWLSVIHQQNKVNRFDGYGGVRWQDIASGFHVSPAVDALIRTRTVPYRMWSPGSLKNYVQQKFELNFKLLKRRLGFYKSD